MTEWLLILSLTAGQGRGVAMERMATQDECTSIGEYWKKKHKRLFRTPSYDCIEVKKLETNHD